MRLLSPFWTGLKYLTKDIFAFWVYGCFVVCDHSHDQIFHLEKVCHFLLKHTELNGAKSEIHEKFIRFIHCKIGVLLTYKP